jgi:hypothetical protein
MRGLRNFCAALVLGLTSNADATVLCSYAAFAPQSIKFFLTEHLLQRGVAVVPIHYYGEHQEINPGQFYIATHSHMLGTMYFHEDKRAGVTVLEFSDVAGGLLARAEEVVRPCRTGLCRHSTYSVNIGGAESKLGVSQETGRGVEYFVETGNHRRPMGVTLWRSQFSEHAHWLISLLADAGYGRPIEGRTPLEDFIWALAVDPDIAPYLPYLSIRPGAGHRIIISGRTNHSIYNLIMSQARRAGYYQIVPLVVIDSGIRAWRPGPPENLGRCL